MAKAIFYFNSGKSLCIEDASKSVSEYYAVIAPTLKVGNIGYITGNNGSNTFVFNVSNIEFVKFES